MIDPQVSNIGIMLIMMQISRRIDMEDEQNILYIRIAYVASIAIAYLIYFITKNKIIAKNDQTKLKIHHAKNPMKPNEPERDEITTVMAYDLNEIESAMKSIYSGAAMMAFMHLYMKYTNPLFMQCISPIKTALEHNEIKIHLFNHAPTGTLKRPFKSQGLLESLMGKSQESGAAAAPAHETATAAPETAAEGVKTE